MRCSHNLALVCLFCMSTGVLAQTASSKANPHSRGTHAPATVVRRASAQDEVEFDQGALLVTTALQQRRRSDARLDCSHLVNTIYSRAGFPYAYAKSTDLYVGVEPFRRVARPQPGDLVVWRGHSGIVIDPVQHSFFSKLRSGLGVDFYDAPYWKRRGVAHFFRYKPVDTRAATTIVARADVRPSPKPQGPQLIATSAHEDHLPVDIGPDVKNAVSRVSQGSLVLTVHQLAKEQLNAAILSKFAENAESLQAADVFSLSQPLTVVDSLEIKKIHVKGDEGWVDVRINACSSILRGSPDFKKRSEHQRWGLSRMQPDTWELALPPETTYLPRDLAAQVFAQQLAALTQSTHTPAAATQKAELARLLNALLTR
jgi:hypothetical protein